MSLTFHGLGQSCMVLTLHLVHGESLRRENVSEVFDSFCVEFALVSAGE